MDTTKRFLAQWDFRDEPLALLGRIFPEAVTKEAKGGERDGRGQLVNGSAAPVYHRVASVLSEFPHAAPMIPPISLVDFAVTPAAAA